MWETKHKMIDVEFSNPDDPIWESTWRCTSSLGGDPVDVTLWCRDDSRIDDKEWRITVEGWDGAPSIPTPGEMLSYGLVVLLGVAYANAWIVFKEGCNFFKLRLIKRFSFR